MKAFAKLANPAVLVTFVLLVLVAVGMAVLPSYMDMYLKKLPVESRRPMRAVSKKLPSWVQVGQDRQEAADILAALGTENTVTRVYMERNPPVGQDPVVLELHIAYYTGMVDTVPHVSERCMIGGGWQALTGSRVIPVQLDMSSWRRSLTMPRAFKASPEAATLTEMRLPVAGEFTERPGEYVMLPFGLIAPSDRDDRKNGTVDMRIADFVDPDSKGVSIIGHFFIANHRLTPSANEVRTLAFQLTDDYAYYVKVQVATTAGRVGDGRARRVQNGEDLAKVASGFVSEVLPEVLLCLPDWVRLEADRIEAKEKAAKGTAAVGKN